MKTLVKRLQRMGVLVFAASLSVFSINAQEGNLSEKLISKMSKIVDADTERIQHIFMDIHEHPELGFMEYRTAEIVAKELSTLGFQVHTEIGITGVVGVLKNGDGPVFMFRADMDANAVEEETGLPYASKVRVTNLDGEETPVAHMCGHDAHTTWLISLAKTMSELKNDWSGTLVLVAQPAEEPIEGAQAMIDDGLFANYNVPKPDYYLAMHTSPFPTGSVLTTAGRLTTGTEHVDVTFHGSGGHGSSPHHATDPVLMAGQAIVQYQTIVSRMIDPEEIAVLTIGSVQAGVDNNVIPTEATLKLKLHFSTTEVRDKMVERITNISNSIAKSNGVSDDKLPSIRHKGMAPAVFNNELFINQIRDVLPQADFVNLKLEDMTVPGSEDAFVIINELDDVKGAYLFLGTADPVLFAQAQKEGKEFPFFTHEPNYQVDLNAIPYGGKLAALIALNILAN